LNTRYTTRSTPSNRSASSSFVGTAYGIRAARIFAFARTSRCAIAVGATRNARAISSTERPQSVLSVSATCASSASAGWQHVKIRRMRSSAKGSSSISGGGAADGISWAISSRFAAKLFSRRSRSIALCRAADTSHARGFRGTPLSGHWTSAAAKAS